MEAIVQSGATSSVAEVCARHDISPATYFRWKKQTAEDAGASSSSEENRRLKRENAMLRREVKALEYDLRAVRHVLMGKLRRRRSAERPRAN